MLRLGCRLAAKTMLDVMVVLQRKSAKQDEKTAYLLAPDFIVLLHCIRSFLRTEFSLASVLQHLIESPPRAQSALLSPHPRQQPSILLATPSPPLPLDVIQ